MSAPLDYSRLRDVMAFHLICERIVDEVGEALGVDTGTCAEARFEAAMDAVETALLSDEGRNAMLELLP